MIMVHRLQSLSLAAWAGIVAATGFLLRLVLWLAYEPVSYSDSFSYRRLAEAILDGWGRYDGTRTPGYPLFLAAVGPDQQVWLVQMGLGLGTTMLFFAMAWLISRRAWFAGLVGLAHTLNLGQLFFEANLITETLATFLVTAALAGTFLWLTRPERQTFWLAVLISTSASLAWLTRPLFIYLPFWLLLFVALAPSRAQATPEITRASWRAGLAGLSISWGKAAAYLVPALVILGLWASYIQGRYHVWSLSVMSGYHLMQHAGNFFELLPDEEAALRDTYLKYRGAQIEETGTQTNTIWDAIPEMQQVSGLNFYSLSRKLGDLSLQLITDHPDLYLQNAAKGWWFFWRAPVYWSPEAFESRAIRSGLDITILVQRGLLFGCNLLFVVTSLAAVFWGRARRIWRLGSPLWCLAGTIWIASVLQTLLDHGDNPRFLVPLQSLVAFWGLWLVYQTALWWIQRGETDALAPLPDAS